MILEITKFGKILNSRPSAREAVLRAKQIINGQGEKEEVIVLNMNGIEVLTPSFADEFIRGIKALYPNAKIDLDGYQNNPVIHQTLRTIGLLN